MKKIIFLMILVMIPAVYSAQPDWGYVEQHTCKEFIQLCGDCTFNNITSVEFPNETIRRMDVEMTQRGVEFNYTFCITNDTGTYFVNGVGDKEGSITVWAVDFYVTENGREEISGILIAFFIVAFIGLSGFMIYTLLRNLAYLVEGETDMSDVALSVLGYCVLWIFYGFTVRYFPIDFVLDLLYYLAYATGFTHLILPIASLFLVMVKKRRIPQ